MKPWHKAVARVLLPVLFVSCAAGGDRETTAEKHVKEACAPPACAGGHVGGYEDVDLCYGATDETCRDRLNDLDRVVTDRRCTPTSAESTLAEIDVSVPKLMVNQSTFPGARDTVTLQYWVNLANSEDHMPYAHVFLNGRYVGSPGKGFDNFGNMPQNAEGRMVAAALSMGDKKSIFGEANRQVQQCAREIKLPTGVGSLIDCSLCFAASAVSTALLAMSAARATMAAVGLSSEAAGLAGTGLAGAQAFLWDDGLIGYCKWFCKVQVCKDTRDTCISHAELLRKGTTGCDKAYCKCVEEVTRENPSALSSVGSFRDPDSDLFCGAFAN